MKNNNVIFVWIGVLILSATMSIAGSTGLQFYFPDYDWLEYPQKIPAWSDTADGVLHGRVERDYARAQDRWIEAEFVIDPELNLADCRLDAELFAPGGIVPLSKITMEPSGNAGRLAVDLRKYDLRQGRIVLTLVMNDEVCGVFEALLTAREYAGPALPENIPLLLDTPRQLADTGAWPVTFGVPFPAGALWNINDLRLVDESGDEIQVQKEITGYWARDGAIQWVRFDALIQPDRRYFLEFAAPSQEYDSSLKVTQEGALITLDTGVARYMLGGNNSPIAEVRLGDDLIADAAGTRGLYLEDQHGRIARAVLDKDGMRIEARGPVAACVRCEGEYVTDDGITMARYIVRIKAYAGQPFARVTHTLILTENTDELWFRNIGWEFNTAVGDDTKAIFNLDRHDQTAVLMQPLDAVSSVSMLQASHFQLGAGSNHFQIAAADQTLHEGDECGDWAIVRGTKAAFLVACRDAALQHPKEFVIGTDSVDLKLFSNRAGTELDFRSATLAKTWNLDEKSVAEAGAYEVNAAGWAKTHELLFAAIPDGEDAALTGYWHSHPVYALIAPEWIHASSAMGPVYPCDKEQFPHAEALIEDTMQRWAALALEPGHYGFINYYAGPTYSGPANKSGRYRSTYGIRPSTWLAYVRSGDRAARRFAEGTNRSFMDNWLTHWDVPGKVRGVYLRHGGAMESYPFFWGGESAFQIDSSTDLNQFIWLYQLTGYRRARDVVEQFAAGLKAGWRPDMHAWRKLMVFRVLTQTYAFTWDPELRALADATFSTVYDPASAVKLTKENRPYKSSTYKLGVDYRGIIEAARLHDTPFYRGILVRLLDSTPGATWPIAYMHPYGVIGGYIYETVNDSTVAASLEYAVRRAATARGTSASSASAVLEGLPYAMSVVARSGAMQQRSASWLAFQDYGFPTRVIAYKDNLETLELQIRLPWGGWAGEGVAGQAGGIVTVTPLGQDLAWGLDLNRVTETSASTAKAVIPKDAPGGAYEISYEQRAGSQAFAGHFVMTHSRAPLVLYAPEYWQLPDMLPPADVYFKVPPASDSAAIFLEGLGKLYDPAGKVYGDPEGVRGWIDLPADNPGLWRLEPLENRLVRVSGIPPFFAMHEPEFYFEPPLDWESDVKPRNPVSDAGESNEERYQRGLTADLPDNQALLLMNAEFLELTAGPPHASGDGGIFIPRNAGTVEFFFRPRWSTFDLGPEQDERSLVRIITEPRGNDWGMTYRVDPEGTTILGGPRGASHALYGWIFADSPNRSRPYHVRAWMQETLVQSGEWLHIAYVWGLRPAFGPRGEPMELVNVQMFLNGRSAHKTVFSVGHDGVLPLGTPVKLVIGPLDGVIDMLRVSDVQRYTESFKSLEHPKEWQMDAHTRALFLFKGNLTGISFDTTEIPVLELKNEE